MPINFRPLIIKTLLVSIPLLIILFRWIVFSNKTRERYCFKYFPNGKIKSKISYIMIKKEKIQHGITILYNENESIKAQLEYSFGILNGVQEYFDSNGKKTSDVVYKMGELISTFNY
jgi:antitoxin component YwqK of YwqJK toxin-antitoxin module